MTLGNVRPVPGGSVTTPIGFRAGAVAAGIKPSGRADLGIIASDRPCVAAGVFTQNAFAAAPVLVSRERITSGCAQAIVFNAGNANACTGVAGMADAEGMARLAANVLGIDPSLLLVASTGVIGQPMPMDRVREGLRRIDPSVDGGHAVAEAMMTTDTRVKEAAVEMDLAGTRVRVGGAAKGVGMIHPNMATMLAFVTTDARLDLAFARRTLEKVVGRTFNMLTVDGDTSTNDCCFLLANGAAGVPILDSQHADGALFASALESVCTTLVRAMAADGEGATKLIEVEVTGAATESDARAAAREVVRSSLVKAAVYGQDPNWGRILAAVGNSSARVDPTRAALWLGDVQVACNGGPVDLPREQARQPLLGAEVHIRVDLGLGTASARAWGCDLTEQYVVENSAYTT